MEVLVRLHVEEHGEEGELDPGDEEERDQDDGRRRHLVAHDAEHSDRDPEPQAGHPEHQPEPVEEHERVEVPDHVLLLQPPEEALEQQPGDGRDDAPQPNPALLLDAVDRPRRDVAHAAAPDVQVHEDVVLEPVARVQPVEVEQLQRLEVDRRVAGLRIGDVPVAGGDLRQEREDRVAEVAVARKDVPRAVGEQPVGLRVIAFTATHDADERLELVGIHLAVGGHHRGHVDPLPIAAW